MEDITKDKINIAVLFERVNSLTDDVKEIRENHLAHINMDLREIKVSLVDLKGHFQKWMGGLSVAIFLIGLGLTIVGFFIK